VNTYLCNPRIQVLEGISCAIQYIGRLPDGFGRRVPVFLLDCVANEGVDRRFERVVGIGCEDDVFELSATR
jgi:hypothetical protein